MTAEQTQRPASDTAVRTVQAPPVARAEPALPGFEHRFATVEGIRLHYVRGGPADGEVVVLLPGLPESWRAWRKVMPLLADAGHRVIALDLPGRGDSDRPAGGYDTRTLAVKVHGLLRQLGVHRYCMAAHDLGAWVAYPYAMLFGDEVRRLALLDAGIPGITLPETVPTGSDQARRLWHFPFHTVADLPETLIAGREREYLEWFLRQKAMNPEVFSDADIEEYRRVFLRAGGLRATLAYYRAVETSARQNRELCEGGKAADTGSGPRLRPGVGTGHGIPARGFRRGDVWCDDNQLRPLRAGGAARGGRPGTGRVLPSVLMRGSQGYPKKPERRIS